MNNLSEETVKTLIESIDRLSEQIATFNYNYEGGIKVMDIDTLTSLLYELKTFNDGR
jgi:hypothetical protein